DWPSWWSNIITPCQIDTGYVWLLAGSFEVAQNYHVADRDIDNVPAEFAAPGIVLWNGYFLPLVPAGFPDYCKVATVYDGKVIASGGSTPPMYWDGDESGGEWVFLRDDD